MKLPGTFYSKLSAHNKLAQTQQAEHKTKPYCCLHNLIVCHLPYTGRHSLNEIGDKDESLVYTNPKTSLYLCKRYESRF